MKKIKTLFCWPDISGYMAACWRKLLESQLIDVEVIAFQAKTQTAFSASLMLGIPSTLLDLEQRENTAHILELAINAKADVIVVPGWMHAPYRKLVGHPKLKGTRFIMTMDTPYWGQVRQQVAALALKSYLSGIDRVVVSGERSWQYARKLGFKHEQIHRGQYGVDYDFFSAIYRKRVEREWPRQFLFIGRYAKEKAIDILVEAYKCYRQEKKEAAWPLVCCGKGPLEHLLQDIPGIENKGFVQPEDLEAIMLQAGALVLPSRFDPWPLAIVENCAAGLPVVCTEVCGTSVELVRHLYNGLVVPENNIDQLYQALLTLHDNYENLPTWGKRAQHFAAPYSAEQWVIRWEEIIQTNHSICPT